MSYAITVEGGSVMHAVTGAMDDHRPWRDAVTTMCGRQLVAINYYQPEEFRQARDRGRSCVACTKAAEAQAMLSTVVIRQSLTEQLHVAAREAGSQSGVAATMRNVAERFKDYGWCEAHGSFEHWRKGDCVGFVSDADHTAALIAGSAAHDAANEGRKEAMYVAEHRPY